ncbi:putative outer membrane starch-binding protein [Dyadobacter jejuensis]|uniref:Putative outer membrane starch-binding protein n=1 Tax=Dyadobacter jejuensis TaxID=1082580 RepID=A0A316B3N5_9BACT|nr:RagB/SusD family nutrient uptake outer membrane protein [Dyadobacter jejuensis]PWJ57177.1 putative outer membrane starch-binding protein [Dyadobacter jejuensis]
MKKIRFKYLLLVLALLNLTGCDDFLTQVNPNEMSTDSFWQNLDDADAGLIAVYNAFKNQNIMSIGDENNRADMTYPGYGRPNTSNIYYLQNFNNGSSTPNNKWIALYTGIFRANQVINAIDKLMPTYKDEASISRGTIIKAQAHFFRGLFYSYLYNSYNEGSVPLFDFVPEDESQFYQGLQPADKVLEFFVKDLEYARENLPVKWTATKDIGRVTKGAATAVLGMTYLYEKDYNQAITYFKDVIENPEYGYSLMPSIGDNFTTKSEFNKESILEISYSLAFKSQINPYDEQQVSNLYSYMVSPVGGYRSVYPSSWLIMAYKNEAMDTLDTRNFVKNADGTQRLRSYSLRTSYSIALVDDKDLNYYQVLPAQAAAFNNGETAYYRKYSNWDIVTNEKDIFPNQRSGVNVRVIRLADVYLMYAECLIQGGTDEAGVAEALRYINKVRYRSALRLIGPSASSEHPGSMHDEQAYTAAQVMDHLMYVERPLELSLEGHAERHIDLRRWGITKQRFEELSKKVYYGEHYPYVDVKGKPATRWASVLTEGTKTGYVVISDYGQAAQNYVASQHAYWPLPNVEVTTNPSILTN